MAKRGVGKKALKAGALAYAIEAHADKPSPVAVCDTELARVQEVFSGPGVARAIPAEMIDAAVLHLWDVGACPGAWPQWADDRFPHLEERGLMEDREQGAYTLTTAGFELICRQAGRTITDAAPRACACPICASLSIPAFTVMEADPSPAPSPGRGEGASDDYRAFLEAKIKLATSSGFETALDDINPALAPHARAITRWALAGGQRAIFASFGLHKTAIQIELMRQITRRTNTATLIVIPLGVRQEFTREAEVRFTGEYAVRLVFIRIDGEFHADAEARHAHWVHGIPTIYLTNYESVREGKLDVSLFVAASLDEAAVLRSFGSKTYQEFLPLFEAVRFRFVATATPSPNRLKELIHYAGFLGVMDTGQALTRFFQRNSEKANDLTLYPHHEEEFWVWVHSWAVFLQKPSDLGFSDEGFALPPLTVEWHEVETDHEGAGVERDGQKLLFRDAAIGLQAAAAEKRDSLGRRIARVLDIVRSQRISAAVPPGQQGEGPGAGSGVVREEQVERAEAREALDGGEPGAHARAAGEAHGGEPPESDCAERQVVSGQQNESIGAGEEAKAGGLRADRGGVSAASRRAKRQVRDLPDREGVVGRTDPAALRGSLPPNQDGAGAPLPEMQRGPGNVQGLPGAACEGDGLSDQIVVWCHLNDEQDALEGALSDLGVSYSSLTGTQDIEAREALVREWKDRHTSVFLSKPTMYGAGVNLQQSHTMIFAGVNYSFHDVFQAVHRVQRFGQKHACTVHIIFSEAEREIVADLKRKWALHDEMQAKMAEIIRTYGLDHSAMSDNLRRSIGVTRQEVSGERFTLALNDCVEETKTMEENSVALVVTSIPFANQYEYVAAYEDMGHTDDNDHFWAQMDFLSPELHRILQPGRLACIHVKDRINFGAVTGKGVPTVSPFHSEAIQHFIRHGFDYMGMITVVTDVVRENNQTYRLGWSENAKDGTKMGVGSPEYVLLMRKPQSDRAKGYADLPVAKPKEQYTRARWQTQAHAFWRSSGNRSVGAEELAALPPDKLASAFTAWSLSEIYDHENHVMIGEALESRGALPATFMAIAPGSHHPDVWCDVNRMMTLNSEQARRRVEMHVCPLQFDIVDRCIERYSMKGELVFDPFAGLGTVPYRAILKGRRGRGSELNPASFRDAVYYCTAAERQATTPTLFDALEAEDAAAEGEAA